MEETMERNTTLGFAVATMEAALLANETFVRQLRGLREPVVIVNQYREKDIDPSGFGDHVKVLNVQSRGLSLSRNLAMKALDDMGADHVVLCDDDIELIPEGLEALRTFLEGEGGDAAMVFTQLRKSTGELWRAHYESDSFSLSGLGFEAKRRVQTINSMEQVYNLGFLRSHGLQFDPDFGAGSGRYQMGEETLMSWSILAAGGTLLYLPVACRSHPPLCSGSTYSGALMRAIFAVHQRMFGALSPITFSVFFVKSVYRECVRRLGSRTQFPG